MESNVMFSRELVKRVGKLMVDKEYTPSRFAIELTPQQIKDAFQLAYHDIESVEKCR